MGEQGMKKGIEIPSMVWLSFLLQTFATRTFFLQQEPLQNFHDRPLYRSALDSAAWLLS